ncbi:MAG: PIG-L family deacetylase [Verrucomicrobia bacterium]|nr:PIG-L family deacetylase [Verrucomicrobiota bacterium]
MSAVGKPAVLGVDSGPWENVGRWLVLAPHPDDFDVVAVTLRRLADAGAGIALEVLSGGASGVEDGFANGWEAKTAAREEEQRESCELFGPPGIEPRFHRLKEDAEGHIADGEENRMRVHDILNSNMPDGVILPHGNDSNADHRRTFRWFRAWCDSRPSPPLALLVRDPKNLGMRVDLVTPYDAASAVWKGALLRCHRSQHARNLRSRGIGFDERILAPDREAGEALGFAAAECFEIYDPVP